MAEQGTVTDEVTDDALSAAWDEEAKGSKSEVVEEEVEEVEKEVPVEETPAEVKEETPPETPASAKTPEELEAEALSHKESSKLGRKVHGLAERLAQAEAKLANTLVTTEEPDVITTPQDYDQLVAARTEKSHQIMSEYQANYLKQLQALKSGEDEYGVYDEVIAELMLDNSPYNRIFGKTYADSNPFADARVNFSEAKVAVLKKRYAEKPTGLPKRETAIPSATPSAVATREVIKQAVLPKLDKAAQDYANYLRSENVPEDEIAEALK
jgi:hypothetical protein